MSLEKILVSMIPYALMAAGVFTIVCSVKEYPFFVEHRKARLIAWILGKTGMKIFYVTLGAALIAVGILLLFMEFLPDRAP